MNNDRFYLLSVYDDRTLVWSECSGAGDVLQESRCAAFSDLPRLAPKAKLIVLLPGQWVFTTEVSLPKASHQDVIKALPFLIEEKVAAPVEELHLVSQRQPRGRHLVFAIEQSKIAALHEQLKTKGYTPVAVLPDFMALPYHECAWVVAIEGGVARVRFSQTEGATLPQAQLAFALQLKAKQHAQQKNQAVQVYCHNQAEYAQIAAQLSGFSCEFCADKPSVDPEVFAQKPLINLLQGPYRLKPVRRAGPGCWRWVLGAAMGLVLTLLGVNVGQWGYFSHRVSVNHAQIAAIAKHLYPAQTPKDVQAFIAHELQRGQANQTQDQLVQILATVGTVLTQFNQLDVQSMDYQHNQLTLTVAARKLADLGDFATQLEHTGLVIKQNQVDTEQKSIQGKLVLERRGA